MLKVQIPFIAQKTRNQKATNITVSFTVLKEYLKLNRRTKNQSNDATTRANHKGRKNDPNQNFHHDWPTDNGSSARQSHPVLISGWDNLCLPLRVESNSCVHGTTSSPPSSPWLVSRSLPWTVYLVAGTGSGGGAVLSVDNFFSFFFVIFRFSRSAFILNAQSCGLLNPW